VREWCQTGVHLFKSRAWLNYRAFLLAAAVLASGVAGDGRFTLVP
jgi:hypothetical protein